MLDHMLLPVRTVIKNWAFDIHGFLTRITENNRKNGDDRCARGVIYTFAG